ncbi:oligosaccharide flippase family protein [Seohaeicola saemankumensis]|uniref:Oligosaccharide flippase family protein n=1 Tax=Seohaeicola saemankumensis TaxID=481181 RepID=A0ABW3TGD8_9RHOB
MTDGVVSSGRMHGLLTSGGLSARLLRSSFLTVAGFGFSQVMRLLSNLVLTRLLFPEAFGLMGIVVVFMIGLQMFSDVGIGPAISRSTRGDDPVFLDTTWTVQILRGIVLFMAGCLLAYPISVFYEEPLLFGMLLLASVQFLVAGVMPTRRETANRHLALGRVTLLEMAAQVVGLIIMVGLAFWLQSVWALVIGTVIGSLVQVTLMTLYLPGYRNRLRLESEALREVIQFGKWIFLSTIFGFLLVQGDKLILGKFLALDLFGIYNIGFFLGSFPMMLGMMVVARVLIPVYRDCPPAASRENFLKLRKMRVLVTTGLLLLLACLAFVGPLLVDLMYDDRYLSAGAVSVLIACINIPVVIGLTYDQAALAAGESRRFFFLTLIKASLTILGLLIGVSAGGLIGALIGQGIGILAAYPALVWLSSRLGVWDPLHDLGFAVLGLFVACGAIWWNWDAIMVLAA